MARKIPHQRLAEYIKPILLELDHLGAHARLKELFPRAEVKLNLNDYEREPYAKSGFIRWQAIVHFNSIPPREKPNETVVFDCRSKRSLGRFGRGFMFKENLAVLPCFPANFPPWRQKQLSSNSS
jgi:hypothetical protein